MKTCLLIATWQTAGRTTECVYLSYDNLIWNRKFCCIEAEIVQSKTSKVKRLPLVASANHHLCFFTRLGDMLALERTVSYRPDMGAWLFPTFQSLDRAGSAIGRIIKDVDVRLDNARFKAEAKATGLEFVNTAVGASLRPGAITTMYADVPANQVICTSGHDMSGDSKMFGYVDVNVATCILGATVLADWPSPGYGKPTKGPRPASVDALAHQGVDMKLVDDIVDYVFDLHPAHPPMLLRAEVRRDGYFVNPGGTTGALRQAVLCAFASLVMHYEERTRCGFFLPVQVKLREAVTKAFPGCPSHAKLTNWGRAIREAFDADNIHLSAYHETEGMERMLNMMQNLARQVGHLAQNVRMLENTLPAAIAAKTSEQVAQISSRMEEALQVMPTTRSRRVAQDDVGDEDNMIVDGEGEGGGGNTTLALVPVHEGANCAIAVAGDVETSDAGLPLLRTHLTQNNAPRVCEANSINDLFRSYMEAGATPLEDYAPFGENKHKNSNARHAVGFFYEMATLEERKQLKDESVETRWRRIDIMEDLVVMARAWWSALYVGQGLGEPNTCMSQKPGARPKPKKVEWVANLRKRFKDQLVVKLRDAGETLDASAQAKYNLDMRACGVAAWRQAWESEKQSRQFRSQCRYPPVKAPWEPDPAASAAARLSFGQMFRAAIGGRDSTGA